MDLSLYRVMSGKESTLGVFYINNSPECFTLEDEFRLEKKSGETRIPAGTYEVTFNENITPMTEKYRKRYKWFTFHLQIQDVPNFKYVYIHVGNDDGDTEGCILLGDTLENNQYDDGFIGNSRKAFERAYKKVSNVLKDNGRVKITIKDLA